MLWALLIAFAYLTLVLISSGHALINRPKPRSALVWLFSIWFLPLVGMLLYVVFGYDRIRRRALLKGLSKAELHRLYPAVPAFQTVLREYTCPEGNSIADVHKVASRLTRRALLQKNQATSMF